MSAIWALLGATSLLVLPVGAQAATAGAANGAGSSAPKTIDPKLNPAEDRCLNDQDQALLAQVSQVLDAYPPQFPEPLPRRLSLLLLDGVLHDVHAPQRPPVQSFFHARMTKAVEEIEKTPVKEGARIWKLYNDGFVVRTPSVTLGFDLVRAHYLEGFAIPDELMQRLVRQCDGLFISHAHGDHADEWVAQAFLEQGKPVLTPPQALKSQPFYDKLTHLKREADTRQSVPLGKGKAPLSVVCYPGHQGADVENNASLVFTAEGLCIAQTGDQSDDSDFAWIDKVHEHHPVDVMLPNCWTTDIARAVKGFAPKLVITGHENEMGHSIDHREPYWLTYQRKVGSERFGGNAKVGYPNPLLVMTWGESYHYQPAAR